MNYMKVHEIHGCGCFLESSEGTLKSECVLIIYCTHSALPSRSRMCLASSAITVKQESTNRVPVNNRTLLLIQ